jgi:hypothetical protein
MNHTPNERLIGECARLLGKTLTDMIAHNFRAEEYRDIWDAFTEACQAGIRRYEERAERLIERLRPGRN